ncbi:siderophore-interacting protein [Paraglaciecola aquimarina]|uniref:Siderophore-interacting protein n=1 Tax=Paraglaciecola algarum TaxID=3050085 RepID=A0ABS9D6J3_9ALTE|nr:siderophore-interacting protein [Paraglaciecola sp. G1-23]MCF2948045.1 siderophore-interacting protein [Paraglaciecola sp. G1-23]
MKKPAPLQLTVLDSIQVTPNMQRLVLKGDGLVNFPEDCSGSYIKFLFNQAGGPDLSLLGSGQRPSMRTYTIRGFSKANRSIEVDFVRHLSNDLTNGFAARWAINAQVGDTINIAGPGNIKAINTHADWFLMVADMTALPALSAKIRQLPGTAKGYAVIQVTEKSDIQPIEGPQNMQLIWLTQQESLAAKVKSLDWLDGTASIWTACEFDAMRELRSYFQDDKQVDREHIYISSYWKNGVTEDGHKAIKQQDAQQS